MNIIFFGNTTYSALDAEIIYNQLGLTAVVTIPDRIGSRNEITQSPLKIFAEKHNIKVIETTKITEDIIEHIKGLKPDFFVVADYRLILPNSLLTIPTYAPLNIHHSLLPKYRGSSPVPSALLAGEEKTGVTIIHMNDKLDDGDILAQKEYDIRPDDTSESLLKKLNEMGAHLAIDVMEHFSEIIPIKQDATKATFTRYMTKQDGFIDINNPPSFEKLNLMIQAYYPWPGTWTQIKIKNREVRIKFLPNKKIQVEGKKPLTIKDFLNGYPEAKELLQKIKFV